VPIVNCKVGVDIGDTVGDIGTRVAGRRLGDADPGVP
jgi:hypothetical protein